MKCNGWKQWENDITDKNAFLSLSNFKHVLLFDYIANSIKVFFITIQSQINCSAASEQPSGIFHSRAQYFKYSQFFSLLENSHMRFKKLIYFV